MFAPVHVDRLVEVVDARREEQVQALGERALMVAAVAPGLATKNGRRRSTCPAWSRPPSVVPRVPLRRFGTNTRQVPPSR